MIQLGFGQPIQFHLFAFLILFSKFIYFLPSDLGFCTPVSKSHHSFQTKITLPGSFQFLFFNTRFHFMSSYDRSSNLRIHPLTTIQYTRSPVTIQYKSVIRFCDDILISMQRIIVIFQMYVIKTYYITEETLKCLKGLTEFMDYNMETALLTQHGQFHSRSCSVSI